MAHRFRTEPFAHQREWWEKTWQEPSHALFWEQGTGKTKLVIDTAAALHDAGEIDTVLIIAPRTVHTNWVLDEVPTHLPEEVLERSSLLAWRTASARTQWHRRAVARLVRHEGLAWLSLTYDAMMTDLGRAAAWRLLRDRRCLYVLDESGRVKTPGAKRTKRVIASGRYARWKRILDGTPVTNSPFDVYSPIKFLDQEFWERHGIPDSLAFRHEHAVFRQSEQGGTFPVRYRNLERLRKWLEPISSRVTKDEVLDLPPKLYTKRRFEMSPEQWRAYNELRDDFITWLDSGEPVTAPLIITRLLRLQQVTCGYLPTGDPDRPLSPLGSRNPRLDALREVVEGTEHQAIVWAKFRQDIDLIMEMLGRRAARLDGGLSESERELSIRRWRAGEVQYLVSNPAVGGSGLTLCEARAMIYYSNSFRLWERLQSEDRAHRHGQQHPVLYTDLLAEDTIDEHIARSLSKKLDIASKVTGDDVREWL